MKALMMLPASTPASILQNMVIGKNRVVVEKADFLIEFEPDIYIIENRHK
jgi:hypothetical protein